MLCRSAYFRVNARSFAPMNCFFRKIPCRSVYFWCQMKVICHPVRECLLTQRRSVVCQRRNIPTPIWSIKQTHILINQIIWNTHSDPWNRNTFGSIESTQCGWACGFVNWKSHALDPDVNLEIVNVCARSRWCLETRFCLCSNAIISPFKKRLHSIPTKSRNKIAYAWSTIFQN